MSSQLAGILSGINKRNSMLMACENLVSGSPCKNLSYLMAKVKKKQMKWILLKYDIFCDDFIMILTYLNLKWAVQIRMKAIINNYSNTSSFTPNLAITHKLQMLHNKINKSAPWIDLYLITNSSFSNINSSTIPSTPWGTQMI